jgi:hypothetical protein
MIRPMFLCLVLVCGAGAAFAQEPACKIDASLVNISKDAGGGVQGKSPIR